MPTDDDAPEITFTAVDVRGDDRSALVRFVSGHEWPFHVNHRPTADQVAGWLEAGEYDDEDHAAYWVDHRDRGRVGLVVLEDLTDDAPLFDLRIATEHRGHGLGAVVLRELTRFVFTTLPAVDRLEGQTREDNAAMRSVFLGAGFVKEAHYRDGWPRPDGPPLASVAYAILRRDWVSGTTTPVPWD